MRDGYLSFQLKFLSLMLFSSFEKIVTDQLLEDTIEDKISNNCLHVPPTKAFPNHFSVRCT